MTDEICNCPPCIAERLYPASDTPEDRTPVIVGVDISTKAVALSVVPVLGDINDIGALQFGIESKTQPMRCTEAFSKTLTLIDIIDQSVNVTSVAVESPVGFGGKLLPLVGAVTAACGSNVEWYSPTTWQSLIRKHYGDGTGEKAKERAHTAIIERLPDLRPIWEAATEDQRDAMCIGLAHAIETLEASDLTEADLNWLTNQQ